MPKQPELEKGMILTEALAEYYECEPEDIRGFVVACEWEHPEEGLTLSSAWSIGTPIWHLLAFVEELKMHLLRNRPEVNAAQQNGEGPNRAARRGGSRGRSRGRRS